MVKARFFLPQGLSPDIVESLLNESSLLIALEIIVKDGLHAVVPQVWDFIIGGYQVARKWLADRKSLILNYCNIQHYLQVVCVIERTIGIQQDLQNYTLELLELLSYMLTIFLLDASLIHLEGHEKKKVIKIV